MVCTREISEKKTTVVSGADSFGRGSGLNVEDVVGQFAVN